MPAYIRIVRISYIQELSDKTADRKYKSKAEKNQHLRKGHKKV